MKPEKRTGHHLPLRVFFPLNEPISSLWLVLSTCCNMIHSGIGVPKPFENLVSILICRELAQTHPPRPNQRLEELSPHHSAP
jgi:hypothetical protein